MAFHFNSSVQSDSLPQINFDDNFYGNYMFASFDQIDGRRAEPRDDIESLIYLLTYLLNDEKLP